MIGRNVKPVPDWRWNLWWGGSAFVEKGASIREGLLLRAVEIHRKSHPKAVVRQWNNGIPTHYAQPGILLHWEGGREYDRHCRRLVKDGLMKVERLATNQSCFGGGIIRLSFLVPTEKGFAEADRILAKKAA